MNLNHTPRSSVTAWVHLAVTFFFIIGAGMLISAHTFPAEQPGLIALPVGLLFLAGSWMLFGRIRGLGDDAGEWRQILLLAAALLLREAVLPIETEDYTDFLAEWMRSASALPDFTALGKTIGNYNAPYFYIVFLVAKLTHPISIGLRLPYIKLASVAGDLLLALAARLLTEKITGSRARGRTAFLAALFLPTVFVNGALWGQCDCMYTVCCLMGLYFGLNKKSAFCMIAFALALALKLQSVFLIPMLLVFLITDRIRWRDLWMFPATFFITLVPALLAGRPFIETIGVYMEQAGRYASLSLFAPSVFGFIPGSRDLELAWAANAGTVAAFVFLGALLVLLYRNRNRLDDRAILCAALVMAIGIPFLLPHMHERYFYAAELLALVCAFDRKWMWHVSLLVTGASFLAYIPYMHMNGLGEAALPYLSGLMLIALILAVRALLNAVNPIKTEEAHGCGRA